MIKVKFFGQLRELLACDEVSIELPTNFRVCDLLTLLSTQTEKWATYLRSENVLVAVNQEISSKEQILSSGDEVAFFPPVTGG